MTRLSLPVLLFGYVLGAVFLGAVLIFFDIPGHFLAVLMVPIFVASMHRSRQVYFFMTAVFIADSLWVTYFTSSSFSSSQRTIAAALVMTVAVAEILRWSMRKRLEIEETLRSTLQTSADIARSISSGLLVFQYTAPDTFTLVEGNPAAERISGLSAIDYVGKSLAEILPESGLPVLKKELADVVRTGEASEIEALPVDVGDFSAVVRARVFLMPGERVGLAFDDVTEKLQAERERLRLEEQMQHAQKLESLGVLAGGIAHDFNNILLAIMGNAGLALTDLPEGGAARMSVEEIEKAARRGAELTRQMLAYSGKGQFVIKPIDLTESVEEMAQLLRSSASKRAALRLELKSNLPLIKADPAQIQQIVMNLITNASEAFGEEDSGRITVTTGLMDCDEEYLKKSRLPEKPEPGRYVYVEVIDTGCGMSEETKTKLFEPFFTTKFAGRGLGMSAILGIVRGHEGAILVDSVTGEGTQVRVLFPELAEKRRESAARLKKGPAKLRVPLSGTVLLVDDEEQVRTVAGRVLERTGLTVLTARDGQEALEVLGAHNGRIDCIVLDLSMPNMDGIQTLRELRALNNSVPVVLSSGFSEQEIEGRAGGEDVAEFIQKPYVVGDLEAVVQRILGAGQRARH